MTLASLSYAPPIRRSLAPSALDYQLLDAAAAAFDAGQFREAAEKVFAHLFPGREIDLTKSFSFLQGSSRVSAKLEGDDLYLWVPLVRLAPGGGAVAALRHLLSRVNGPGQLHQARLRADDVQLEYREQLSRLHPQKLLEILRRMPLFADMHDDWMISQFGSVAFERGSVTPLSDEELTRAEALWQRHWSDLEELLHETQRKRSLFFLNEVTAFSGNRIRFALPLGGTLVTRLNENANVYNNPHVDPLKRETTLGATIKEMKAVNRELLGKSLGHAEYAISPVAPGTVARLLDFFGKTNYMETIWRFASQGLWLDAALPLIGSCYYLLINYTWPREIEEALKNGLASVSDKPWREAGGELFGYARGLADRLQAPPTAPAQQGGAQ